MMKITCEQAKQIDLVDYLATLGDLAKKIRNQKYWFLSPFRKENTPSFKVNRSRGIWFDFGIGKGGDIVDFGVQFFQCSVSEWLQRLSEQNAAVNLSFQRQQSAAPIQNQSQLTGPPAGEKESSPAGKILVRAVGPLVSPPLLAYLQKRGIPLPVAGNYCLEVKFELYHKERIAIGFPNNAGGYELRSENFKGSSSPKEATFFDNGGPRLAVFEGFFDFLSFQAMQNESAPSMTNFLVLNSLSFLEKSRSQMESHQGIDLFLNRDIAGLRTTETALKWSDRYKDQSLHYRPFKDLNDYLVYQLKEEQKQSLRSGRRL